MVAYIIGSVVSELPALSTHRSSSFEMSALISPKEKINTEILLAENQHVECSYEQSQMKYNILSVISAKLRSVVTQHCNKSVI